MAFENEDLKRGIALARCVRAAFLLSSLRSSSDRRINATGDLQTEGLMRKEIQELKIELVHERLNSKKIRLCSSVEFIFQVMLILSISVSFFYLTIVLEYQ